MYYVTLYIYRIFHTVDTNMWIIVLVKIASLVRNINFRPVAQMDQSL